MPDPYQESGSLSKVDKKARDSHQENVPPSKVDKKALDSHQENRSPRQVDKKVRDSHLKSTKIEKKDSMMNKPLKLIRTDFLLVKKTHLYAIGDGEELCFISFCGD